MIVEGEIPRHITGLYLYTIISVLLLCKVTFVDANVIVRRYNETEPIAMYYDFAARFGPHVPSGGVKGFLMVVKPLDACSEVQPPPNVSTTELWIAIVARDNCTFVDKVKNAQRQGYTAVIVYNHAPLNSTVAMSGDGRGVYIPSVFVGWTDGVALSTTYCYNCKFYDTGSDGRFIIEIDDKEPPEYNPYLLWPFAVVVGTCFVLMLVFMVVKWCRDCRRKRKSRLSNKHLKKIPIKKFKKGDDYDVCAICLDDYEEGDKMRVLPCSHVYHCKCIDPWLTKSKRSCPVCKRKVIPGNDPEDSDSDSDDDGGSTSPSERTPLLGNNNNEGASNRRSTFDNSGLPETVRNNNTQLSNSPVGGPTSAYETVDLDSDDDSSVSSELGAVGGIPRSPSNQNNEQCVVIEHSSDSHVSSRAGQVNQGYHSSEEEEEYEVVDEELEADHIVHHADSHKKESSRNGNHIV